MKSRCNKLYCGVLVCAITGSLPTLTHAYPLDGYADTGIRRLEAARLIEEGELKGRRQPPGATLASDQVDLRVLADPELELPPVEAAFS